MGGTRLKQTELDAREEDSRSARCKAPPVPRTTRPRRRGNSSHGTMYKEMLRNGKNSGIDIFGVELPPACSTTGFKRSYALDREQHKAGLDPIEWGPQSARGRSESAAFFGPRRRELDRRVLMEQSRH